VQSKVRLLPILDWGLSYKRDDLTGDLLAALIVTIMLIPQSLAYALLAGLPPQMGLYASILPLVAYTLFGTSRTLSVGPVAVVSLMTATAVGSIAEAGSVHYIEAAISLALISGLFLLLLGLLRFGFLANFLSHPVVAGFITASGLLIAVSQLKHLAGIQAHGDNLPELVHSLWQGISNTNFIILSIGMLGLLFLIFVRSKLAGVLRYFGISESLTGMLCKAGPIVIVILSTLVAWYFQLDEKGVAVIGDIPAGLPSLQFSGFENIFSEELFRAAILISIIGYVESVSVGKTLGAKRRQRIDPDQELVALGASNVASAVSGGFPVTGGFSRSVVNFDAGAVTPAAGFFTAIGIAVATLLFTPWLAYLPKATLGATIIVAVIALVDFSIIKKTWSYSKTDFIAVMSTIIITLVYGVELGVLSGVVASIALHLYKTSQPHIAEVGFIEGTEHFRNVHRYSVVTSPHIVSLRVDESLYFANASFLENEIYKIISERSELEHVVLMCCAINEIDISALEVLEAINERLGEAGIHLHLSEVKGPVMDALQRSDFLRHLNGNVFLTQYQAVKVIMSEEQEYEI